jgi:hypothetical protein
METEKFAAKIRRRLLFFVPIDTIYGNPAISLPPLTVGRITLKWSETISRRY